jgi:hypothetical protein
VISGSGSTVCLGTSANVTRWTSVARTSCAPIIAMIADADVRDGGTSELARGVKSCRALLISRCGTGLRLIALEQACWYNRAHGSAPLEQSRMDTEKDL